MRSIRLPPSARIGIPERKVDRSFTAKAFSGDFQFRNGRLKVSSIQQQQTKQVVAKWDPRRKFYRLLRVLKAIRGVHAVKLAPGIPFGHYLLGLLLLDTGDFQA